MDAVYFLKRRTSFIRSFYQGGAAGFADVKRRIEESLPPYDAPLHSEDPEPPFLEEWLDADTALNVLGMACISMLADTLKIYLRTLQEHVIGFSFEGDEGAFKGGYFPTYLSALGEILETDWTDCAADIAIIEQVVLARNRAQHGEHLTSLIVEHDRATLKKHPQPLFVSSDELSAVTAEDGSLGSLLMPTLTVTPVTLERALAEVEVLAEWIDLRLPKAFEWRMSARASASQG